MASEQPVYVPPGAPGHLGEHGRRTWQTVVDAFELRDHELVILGNLADAQDELAEARKAVAADGLTVATRYGVKSHPALAVIRDARRAIATYYRLLSLDRVAEAAGTDVALDEIDVDPDEVDDIVESRRRQAANIRKGQG